ncbi:MAG: phosphoribosylglycinamide formyltransferase [Lachnospiraceae bacterium]|nr:phosphoribosylglycinamide formyltransferase [Lachnospiraceae bacterium]
MLKIAVLVSGGGTNLQAIIDAVKNHKLTDVSIEVVVSNKEDAYALVRAADNGIASVCIRPKDYESKEAYGRYLATFLADHEIDLVVLAGFLVVLPENFVDAFAGKIINIHPSLIPSFCGDGFYGLKVHEAALARGVKITGATVHYVDKGCDTGPIILQKAVSVEEGDSPEILQKRVMEQAEWVILPRAIQMIADKSKLTG